jgi:hypothetical protein
MGILFGIGLILVSVAALYYAMPRQGRVVRLLRRDAVQSCFVVAVIAAMVVGSLMVAVGLAGLDPGSGYQ